MSSGFTGTWKRVKAENEEAMLKYIGYGEIYEKYLRGTEPVMKLSQEGDKQTEKYSRGEFQHEMVTNVGGETKYDMLDGKQATAYPVWENAEKTKMRIEFDYNGIHYLNIRELKGDNELLDSHNYDHGKCIASQLFIKES